MSENIFDQTSTLFSQIVSDAIGPRETRPEYPSWHDFEDAADQRKAHDAAMNAYRTWTPSPGASANARRVRSADDVKVGDVVILLNNTRRMGEWNDRVAADTTLSDLLLDTRAASLAVVVKKTAKRFSVVSLFYGFWTYDHTTLERDDDTYATDMAGSTNARTVVATGLTYEELLAKISADERFPKALKKQAKARAREAKWDAAREAKAKAEQDERAPFKAKAKQVNVAVSVKVVESKDWGTPAVEVRDLKWIGLRDFYALASLALEARLLKAEISQEDHDTALATLRETLGEDDS